MVAGTDAKSNVADYDFDTKLIIYMINWLSGLYIFDFFYYLYK